MFRVVELSQYKDIVSKWDVSVQEEAKAILGKIEHSPFSGKPLGYKFFREKKIKGFRIYYLIYEELNLVLMVHAGDKKSQKKTIKFVKSNFSAFKFIAETLAKS